MNKENTVKKLLKEGGCVFGTWSTLSSPEAMDVMGQAGLDFIVIDMEHGTTSIETARNQVYAAEAAGTTPMMRLGYMDEQRALHALEAGVQGLLVAHVSTEREAVRVVDGTRYYPDGHRGLSPFTHRHGYSDHNIAEKMKYENEQLLVGVMIEDQQGVSNLEKIVAVPGVDLVFLGLYDLSQSVGMPGKLTHPRVVETMQQCNKIIESHSCVGGCVAADLNHLPLIISSGFRFVGYRVDCAVLHDGYVAARKVYDHLRTQGTKS